MKLDGDVLTLAKRDVVGDWPVVRLARVAAVVVPGSCRKTFFDSAAYYATASLATYGVFVFVGPGRLIEVRPVIDRRASLEAASPQAVYLNLKSGRRDVRRTVEAVPGRVFVDLGDGVEVLGVEVLL